ncbi:MAG: Yip1 family protein [Candidatus Anstonellales archaeon]
MTNLKSGKMNINQMIDEWEGVLFKPKETYKELAKRANFRDGLYHLAALCVFYFLFMSIAIIVFGSLFGALAKNLGIIGGSILVALLLGVVSAIAIFITALIYNGILLVMAKILGGKGSFGQQFHMIYAGDTPMTIITSIVSVIATIISPIPCIGLIIYIITLLALWIYSLYLKVIALRETHGYSTFRAVATLVIPVIIISAILVIAILIFFGAFFSRINAY